MLVATTTAPSSFPSDLPNPYTPLAWLDPDAAFEFQISRYLCVATFSAYTVDWIIAMEDEYDILFRSKFRPVYLAYALSRLASFGYILGCVLFQTAPIPNCQALEYALASCFAIALPSTSVLFYLRVCAVFQWHRLVVCIFTFLWISVLLCAFTIVPAISGTHIGDTRYCINTGVAIYSSSSIISNTVNDTLIFFAISWRLTSYSIGGRTWGEKLKSFAKGEGMPRFSRMLLQGGQLYYFVTVALNVASMTLLLSPGLSPFLRAMTTIPNVALENAMATRVFRAIHTGHIAEYSVQSGYIHTSTAMVFRTEVSNISLDRSASSTTYQMGARPGVHGPHGFAPGRFANSKVGEAGRDQECEASIEMVDLGLSSVHANV